MRYRILGSVATLALYFASAVVVADGAEQSGTDTPEPLVGIGDVELGQSVQQLLDTHQVIKITRDSYDDTEKQVINSSIPSFRDLVIVN